MNEDEFSPICNCNCQFAEKFPVGKIAKKAVRRSAFLKENSVDDFMKVH